MPTPTTSMSTPLSFPASMIQQRDVKVFSFVLTAEQVLNIGRVDRFGESSDGVNRQLSDRHVLEIAEAMVSPDTVLLDAICGDLKGPWTYENGLLIAGEGAYLSIDDGQHRHAALSILNPEERERWSFTISATQGLDYMSRLKVFRQQRLRKTIDSRLDLAQRHRMDDWKTDAEREAYNLVLRLNSDVTSPLKGMIILEETVKRPYEHQHRTSGINASGLWNSLKSIMSKGSPLYALSIEKRTEVALNLIMVASEVWPKAWCSSEHILTTARGINAVIRLVVSGKNFRIVVGNDFTVESLRNALELARKFNWTPKAHKNEAIAEITRQLDETIGRNYQRKLESGESEVKA